MKNLLKKLLTVTLGVMILCTVCTGLAGCTREFETEYFKCRQVGSLIELYDLTELGKQQEIIIVPETVNGKKVDILGTHVRRLMGSYDYSDWQSDNLKKLFITHRLYMPLTYSRLPNLQGIFLVYELGDISFWRGDPDNLLPQYTFKSIYGDGEYLGLSPANIGYFYNYENKNNGYYWIDNYAYGAKITFMPPPERNGYTFSGWYKEADCANKWDFDKDTLPPLLTNDEGKTLYQETRLYAKWTKK